MDRSVFMHPQRKRRPQRPEQAIQIGIMTHLLPLSVLKKFLVMAIPNGGYRTKAEAGIMKAMGQRAGAADILLGFTPEETGCVVCRRHGRGVWVELKVEKLKDGKWVKTYPSPEQRGFRALVESLGFDYYVVHARDISHGLNQILEIIKRYVPL